MNYEPLQRDIAELGAALSQGLDAQRFGSFSARNPGLGKMTRCIYCHARRREFATEKCCNARHAATQRAWDADHDVKGERIDTRTEKGCGPSTRHERGFYQAECPPRVIESPFGKSTIRKMLHKRHGQNKNWHRRMLTVRMQQDVHLVEKAAMDMFARPCRKWADILKLIPTAAGIPAFAEQYYTWLQKQESRRARKQRG